MLSDTEALWENIVQFYSNMYCEPENWRPEVDGLFFSTISEIEAAQLESLKMMELLQDLEENFYYSSKKGGFIVDDLFMYCLWVIHARYLWFGIQFLKEIKMAIRVEKVVPFKGGLILPFSR